MMMRIQNLVSFCQFVLKTLSNTQNLTPIKGSIPVANLQKKTTMVYITNLDLVNDDEHIKFGLILSISSPEKTNSDINQGPLLCCKFAKNKDLQY